MTPAQQAEALGLVFASDYIGNLAIREGGDPIKCVSKPVMRSLMQFLRDQLEYIRSRNPWVQVVFNPQRFR